MAPAASEWDEVKRLAADFQRAQASASLQRLSDRNCVDVINKLKDLGLLDVLYSLDGKEYITKEHLKKEISDELFVAGGRIHLTEVSTILNVDISHIESKATELVQECSGSISFVLGQLISQTYKERLIEEIEASLRDTGSSSVGEISKQYDLPAEFVTSLLKSNLSSGSSIQWLPDGTIFTQSFINRYKCRVRGILLASAVPVILSQLSNSPHNIPAKILSSIMEDTEFINSLPGSMQASKASSGKTYVPTIYSQNQRAHVTNFYSANNYLEYKALKSLGISEPRSFISARIPEAIHLSSVAVSPSIEATITEAIACGLMQDLTMLLPSVLSSEDIAYLYDKQNDKNCTRLLCDSVIVPSNLIDSLAKNLEEKMPDMAQVQLKEGKLSSYFAPKIESKDKDADEKSSNLSRKDERRRKAASGSGTSGKQMSGGNQGREIKSKAVKKKPRAGKNISNDDDGGDDEESHGITFMSVDDLTNEIITINSELEEIHPDVPRQVACLLCEQLDSKFADIARNVWSEYISSTAGNSKKKYNDLQTLINELYAKIHLAICALESFNDDTYKDLKSQLTKYTLRSLCTDACNSLISFVTPDENVNLSTVEARNKVINKISDTQVKESLSKLANHLTSNEIDSTFTQSLEDAASIVGNILLKPIDNKKNKLFLSENRHNLLTQIDQTADPSLILHAALLIIFQSVTNTAVHASGKFVPQLIQFLEGKIPSQHHQLLDEMANLVISHVKLSKEDPEKADQVNQQLETLVPRLKQIVQNDFK